MARTQRIALTDRFDTYTVLGADHLPIEAAEEYLQFLRDDGTSPNTVKAYAAGLAAWWTLLEHTGTGNSRKKIPNAEGAYTSLNTRGAPPARSMLTSSMVSAPHMIPAMIEVSLPAGLTAPDFTRVDGRSTCSSINRERPVCSASSSTGTNPAGDTRFCLSNTADAAVNVSDECTENAFPNAGQQDFNNPLSQLRWLRVAVEMNPVIRGCRCVEYPFVTHRG